MDYPFHSTEERSRLIEEKESLGLTLVSEYGDGKSGVLGFASGDDLKEINRARWENLMKESDKIIPRWAEDIFDLATGSKTANDLPELVAAVQSKKDLRGSKP